MRRIRTFYLTYMIQKATGPAMCSLEWRVRTYSGRQTLSLIHLALTHISDKHGLAEHRITLLGMKEL
jgi:hypothetical protein